MNNVEAVRKLNERELELGLAGTRGSWHGEYASCPYIYAGGLVPAVTEGDLLCVFEQFGTVVHVNLVRDKETAASRGFAFLQYEDPRSAVLAVDNFNGVDLLGRTLRVDHAKDYRLPEGEDEGRSFDVRPVRTEVGSESKDEIMDGRITGGVNGGAGRAANGHAKVVDDDERQRIVLERLRLMRQRRAEDEKSAKRAATDAADGGHARKRRRNLSSRDYAPGHRDRRRVDEDAREAKEHVLASDEEERYERQWEGRPRQEERRLHDEEKEQLRKERQQRKEERQQRKEERQQRREERAQAREERRRRRAAGMG